MLKKSDIGYYLLYQLDSPLKTEFKFIENGIRISSHSLSLMIEFYCHMAEGPTSGIKNHTIKMIFNRCINDLIVGFHLAFHSYVPQFYSVLRPIFESLDLIELFKNDEDMAKLWIDDSNYFSKKFSPADIRQKTGRERYDPEYGLFCRFGSHSTIDGVKSSAYLVKERSEENQKMKITLGPSNLIFPSILLFIFSYMLLLKITISMADYFGKENILDARKFLLKIIENHKEYLEKCVLQGFTFFKMDTNTIQEVIDLANSMVGILTGKIEKEVSEK